MTLKRVAPAAVNNIKLIAFALFALGIVMFANQASRFRTDYDPDGPRAVSGAPQNRDKPLLFPVASEGAWCLGMILLTVDGIKSRK